MTDERRNELAQLLEAASASAFSPDPSKRGKYTAEEMLGVLCEAVRELLLEGRQMPADMGAKFITINLPENNS